MTPLLSIWPAESEAPLCLKVNKRIERADMWRPYYECVRPEDCVDKDALVAKLREHYRRMIDISAIDTTLNVVAVLPLFDENVVASATMLVKAVAATGDNMSVHFLCLRRNLAKQCGSTASQLTPEKEGELICAINALCEGAGFPCSASPIDDYIASGASAAFTADSLARYISILFCVMIEHYSAILPSSIFSGIDTHTVAIGLAQLEFPRRQICRHLLNRAFIAALDNSGVNVESVDSQAAAFRAKNALIGFSSFFDDFYKRNITPKLDLDVDEDTITAEIAPVLKEEVNHLADAAMAFLQDSSISLPEKEAAFALLLGEDSSLLTGVQFDSDTALADDAFSQPISLYVSAFNSIVDSERDDVGLPMRESVEGLKKYEVNNEGELVESEENRKAFDALPHIKLLKRDIQDETAHIRKLRQMIEDIQAGSRERSVIEGNPEEARKRALRSLQDDEIQEQPLNDIYNPAPGLEPQKSVDLRSFFSPVKSQGNVGSCTTFAVVSMYEVAMNRVAAQDAEPADMSERFVFYHSNVESGRPEGGSNYFDQLEVLGKYGICYERQCEYTDNNLLAAPSEEATQEALSHRVITARQIPIRTKGSKVDCMKENHRLFTSALSEGLPVGIALKVYSSLETITSPYVHVPDENDILSGGEGHHAMVLAGYSETDNCYIVRNSWGPDYGDKGYIYVSAAYIDDPEFNSFACVITETTERVMCRRQCLNSWPRLPARRRK